MSSMCREPVPEPAKLPLSALVLGLGRSGVAAARLLARSGATVTVVDSGQGSAGGAAVAEIEALGVRVCRHAPDPPAGRYTLGVVSPGIDSHAPIIRQARRRCGEVISELELGYRHCQCPLIGVTGTNGKSTLTKLLHEMLSGAGLRSEPGGNYGTPLCELAGRSATLDWIVAEVSSFQLEAVVSFRPCIGIMLNLQPDHLGRHGSMEHYRALKARLFAKMERGDLAIVHAPELQAIREAAEGEGGKACEWQPLGTQAGCDLRYDATAHAAVAETGADPVVIPLQDSMFDNPILGLAAAAAVGVGRRCGLTATQIQRALVDFQPLAHRMEIVGDYQGVIVINDSKATNLTAVQAALEMAHRPVRLIAGGQLKEPDLKKIKEVLKKRVLSVYLIGQAQDEMESAWHHELDCRRCGNLEMAVSMAWRDAQAGEIILLSPGCASFDQFRSYEDRGEQFKDFVECMVNKEDG